MTPSKRSAPRGQFFMPKTNNPKKVDRLPLNRLYIGLVLAILVAETAVMLAFHVFLETLHLSPLVEGLTDSLVLVIVLFFVFYYKNTFFVY